MPDGYRLYGGRGGDFAGDGASGGPLIIAGATTFTVRDNIDPALGTQVTDLFNQSDLAVTEVTTDVFGNYLFWAPEGLGTLFLHREGLTRGYAVDPVDLASEVLALAGAVVAAQAAQAAAEAAAAAAAGLETRLATAETTIAAQQEILNALPDTYIEAVTSGKPFRLDYFGAGVPVPDEATLQVGDTFVRLPS